MNVDEKTVRAWVRDEFGALTAPPKPRPNPKPRMPLRRRILIASWGAAVCTGALGAELVQMHGGLHAALVFVISGACVILGAVVTENTALFTENDR